MYPYDFRPKRIGINHREIFAAMPFDKEYDPIFDDLIKPATDYANEELDFNEKKLSLYAHRTKEDIRTTSGWINVLEHLFTAKIVIGILTSDNPNVFYELGIAHATQPITRQILIANKGYMPKFNTKDLIYFEYDENNLASGIKGLSQRIVDAIKWHKIEQEKRIKQSRMLIGPLDFEVIMQHAKDSHFALHSNKPKFEAEYDKIYGVGAFERHIIGITNLCKIGLLGLNTITISNHEGKRVEFSYWWTSLGNDLLHIMRLINEDELIERRKQVADFFEV